MKSQTRHELEVARRMLETLCEQSDLISKQFNTIHETAELLDKQLMLIGVRISQAEKREKETANERLRR